MKKQKMKIVWSSFYLFKTEYKKSRQVRLQIQVRCNVECTRKRKDDK